MEASVEGALHVLQDAFDKCKVRLPGVVHEETPAELHTPSLDELE